MPPTSKGESSFWAFAVPGLLLQVAARVTAGPIPGPFTYVLAIATVLYLVGTLLLARAMADYAQSSLNRPRTLGLLAILSLVGLGVLMCLDKKPSNPRPPAA